MTRRTQTATNVLVAVIVAVLALLAVPTRVAVATPTTSTLFTATSAGAGPVLRSAPQRKLRVHHAGALAEPGVPPALPTAIFLLGLSLILLAVLAPAVRRLHRAAAFRLPAVRAPPLQFA